MPTSEGVGAQFLRKELSFIYSKIGAGSLNITLAGMPRLPSLRHSLQATNLKLQAGVIKAALYSSVSSHFFRSYDSINTNTLIRCPQICACSPWFRQMC